MHKKWYKIKRGLTGDTKLAVVAKRAGLSRSECIALYICLLDIASAGTPDGFLGTPDLEEISILTDIDIAKIGRGITEMREKNLISKDDKVTCWATRPAASTLRVRALRSRRKAEQPMRQPPPLHDLPEAVAARRARLMPDTKQNTPARGTPRP